MKELGIIVLCVLSIASAFCVLAGWAISRATEPKDNAIEKITFQGKEWQQSRLNFHGIYRPVYVLRAPNGSVYIAGDSGSWILAEQGIDK